FDVEGSNLPCTNCFAYTKAVSINDPGAVTGVYGDGTTYHGYLVSHGFVYTPDRTPPVTTLTLAGPAGSNGWYLGEVWATSSASDPDNAPAQLTTFCVIDGGSAQTYSAPFTPSGDGVHHISYWSIDPDGNEEAHHLIEVKIDST